MVASVSCETLDSIEQGCWTSKRLENEVVVVDSDLVQLFSQRFRVTSQRINKPTLCARPTHARSQDRRAVSAPFAFAAAHLSPRRLGRFVRHTGKSTHGAEYACDDASATCEFFAWCAPSHPCVSRLGQRMHWSQLQLSDVRRVSTQVHSPKKETKEIRA